MIGPGFRIGIPRSFHRANAGNPAQKFVNDIIDAAGASLYEFHDASQTSYDGGGVLTWPDLSSNTRDMVSPSALASPTVGKSAELQNRPALVFIGGDYLTSVAPPADYKGLHGGDSNRYRVFIIYTGRPTSTETLCATADANTEVGFRCNSTNTNAIDWRVYNTTLAVNAIVDTSNEDVVSYTVNNGNPVNVSSRSSDAFDDLTASLAAPSTADPTDTLFIGAQPSGTSTMVGDICAFIILQNPTASQEQQVESLLYQYYLGYAGIVSDIVAAAGASLFEYHDATRTSYDGGGVLTWPDLSGNGRDAVAPSAASSPPLQNSAELNGKLALNFDGVDDYLVSSAPAADYTFLHDGTARAVVFFVGRDTSSTVSVTVATAGIVGNYGYRMAFEATNVFEIATYNGVTRAPVDAGPIPERYGIHKSVVVSGNSISQIRSPETVAVAEASPLNNATAPTYTLHIGRRPSGGLSLEGDACAVLILKDPTEAQEQQVEFLLNQYYLGLPVMRALPGLSIQLEAGNIVPSGGNAATLLDGSGWGNDVPAVVQAAVTTLNGQPALQGDGAAWYQLPAYAQGALLQPNTAFLAVQWGAAAVDAMDGGTNTNRILIDRNIDALRLFSGVSLQTGSTVAGTGLPMDISAIVDGASSELSGETVNGTFAATGDAGAQAMQGVTIMASNLGATPWQTKWAELTVCNLRLCDELLEIVREYLRGKYL